MNLKTLVVFLLVSAFFGGCVYLCNRHDIDNGLANFERIKMESKKRLDLDYQAYTKPEDDKK